jgi:predicted nucleotidyltransferase
MQDMIDRFVTWAQRRPDVRAGIVLGSWARNDMPADNLSDLDLVVIVSDPSVFLSDAPLWRPEEVRGNFVDVCLPLRHEFGFG